MEEKNKESKALITTFIILFIILAFTVVFVLISLISTEQTATPVVTVVPTPVTAVMPVTNAPTKEIDISSIYNNEYIIIWSEDTAEADRLELITSLPDFEFVSTLTPNMSVVRCDKYSPNEIIERLSNLGGVVLAEPNYIVTAQAVSDDTYAGALWGLHNNGYVDYYDFVTQKWITLPTHHDVDINFPEAKDYYEATYADPHEVIVAVIDTGADINHPDLAGRFWINPGEIPDDGIDNDENGFIDDVYGWDFYNNDNTLFHDAKDYSGDFLDNDTHGTLIAGIISAVAGNAEGIAGAASFAPVKIMPIKVNGGQGNGSGKVSDAINAINYATLMGAKVCNISWGIPKAFSTLESLKYAMESSDMLFVCAAGNAGTDNDETPVYPANLGLKNSMSITMCDHYGKLIVPSPLANYGSNYGAHTVDLAAPGVAITSTIPEGKYNAATGSSFSAPFVSALAAVIMSTNDRLNPADVKQLILSTAKREPLEPTPIPLPEDTPELTPDPEEGPLLGGTQEPESTPSEEPEPTPEEPEPTPEEAEPTPADQTEGSSVESFNATDGTPEGQEGAPETPEESTENPVDSVETPDETNPGDGLEETPSPEPTPSPVPGVFDGMKDKMLVPGIPDMYAALLAAGSLVPDTNIPEIEFTRTFEKDVIVLTVKGLDSYSGVRVIRFEQEDAMDAYKTLTYFGRGTKGALYAEPLRLAHPGIFSFYVADYAGNEQVIQYVLADDVEAPDIKLLTTAASPSGKLVAVLDVTDFESGVSRFSLLPGERSAADFSVAENAPTALEPVDGRLLLRFNGEEVYTLCAYDHRGNISTYTLKSN